jgi:hypothetical protein
LQPKDNIQNLPQRRAKDTHIPKTSVGPYNQYEEHTLLGLIRVINEYHLGLQYFPPSVSLSVENSVTPTVITTMLQIAVMGVNALPGGDDHCRTSIAKV